MTSGSKDWEGQFIEVGWGFLSVLLGSRVLRWRVPEMVLGDAVLGNALLGY
jgi:hypothetical protein